jgi:hypothetical protein
MKKLHHLLLALIVTTCINMGDNRKDGANIGPEFTELEQGQGDYRVTVRDKNTNIELTSFNFSRRTSLIGVRSTKDDSTRTYPLANIRRIKIDNPSYQFNDKSYTEITITTENGITRSNLLIDPLTNISGIAEDTKAQYYWYIHKIEEIKVHHGQRTSKKKNSVSEADQKKKDQIKIDQPHSDEEPLIATSIVDVQLIDSSGETIDPSDEFDQSDNDEANIGKTFTLLMYSLYDFFMSLYYWLVSLIY